MDILSNMLASIMVGYRDRRSLVIVPRSKLSLKVLNLFYIEGLIKGFALSTNKNNLVVFLKYYDREPVIKGLKRISSSGRRVYINSTRFTKFILNTGIFLLSTSRFGLIFSNDSRLCSLNKNNGSISFVGGEVLFRIFL